MPHFLHSYWYFVTNSWQKGCGRIGSLVTIDDTHAYLNIAFNFIVTTWSYLGMGNVSVLSFTCVAKLSWYVDCTLLFCDCSYNCLAIYLLRSVLYSNFIIINWRYFCILHPMCRWWWGREETWGTCVLLTIFFINMYMDENEERFPSSGQLISGTGHVMWWTAISLLLFNWNIFVGVNNVKQVVRRIRLGFE